MVYLFILTLFFPVISISALDVYYYSCTFLRFYPFSSINISFSHFRYLLSLYHNLWFYFEVISKVYEQFLNVQLQETAIIIRKTCLVWWACFFHFHRYWVTDFLSFMCLYFPITVLHVFLIKSTLSTSFIRWIVASLINDNMNIDYMAAVHFH